MVGMLVIHVINGVVYLRDQSFDHRADMKSVTADDAIEAITYYTDKRKEDERLAQMAYHKEEDDCING